MPIHEYVCDLCQSTFEALILRSTDERELTCPRCGSAHVDRQVSRPAAVSAPRGGGGPSSGGCGPTL
jgi:putative FmdB family regulatory protein